MATGTNTDVREESSTERIRQAIQDLTERGRVATRTALATVTGLSMTVVDDRLKMLVATQQVRRPVNGVYEIEDDLTEERAISGTILPNGRYKLEIGDIVITLTPREARNVGALFSGVSMQFRG